MSEGSPPVVSLPPDVAIIAREAVASGEFATVEAVVAEALLEWSERHRSVPFNDEVILRLWNEGLASGPGKPGTMDDIKREGRRRLAAAAQQLG